MTCVNSIGAMIPLLSEDNVSKLIIPVIVKMLDDKVANVQFCTSKLLLRTRQYINKTVFAEKLAPKLKEQSQAKDKDVAYYAKLALSYH